ncbi:MAG TPA: hypothetical protein VGM50_22300 [Gemmatimonadaceae bacterium]|jgi:hypothetical protein
MSSVHREPAQQRPPSSESSVRHFGPWPWYVSAADFVGLDIDLVDDIAGDLSEVCADPTISQHILKRAWCIGQVLRSIPYLAVSTLRRGRPRARRRLITTSSVLCATLASAIAAVQLRVGPPAMIAGERGFDANDIVINYFSAVQLPIRALDARGRTVSKAAIRFEPFSESAIDIAAGGVATCHAKGDAMVHASINDVTSLVVVHCRPVSTIHATPTRFDFVQGDQPRPIHVEALDSRSVVVGDARGSVGIVDTSVAAVRHGLIAPQGPGATQLTVAVGDARASATVVVHELVKRFDNLSPKQRNVAMSLRLGLDDTLHLAVPVGTYWVKWLRRDAAIVRPAITAEGSGYCHMDSEAFIRWLPGDEYGAYCYFSEGARVRVSRGNAGDSSIVGALLLEKLRP